MTNKEAVTFLMIPLTHYKAELAELGDNPTAKGFVKKIIEAIETAISELDKD